VRAERHVELLEPRRDIGRERWNDWTVRVSNGPYRCPARCEKNGG